MGVQIPPPLPIRSSGLVVRTPDCHSGERGFKSLLFRLCDYRLIGKTGGFQPSNLSSSLSGRFCASLAQLAEQLPCKQLVEGSMPSGGFCGVVVQRVRILDCDSGDAGSTPAHPSIIEG